jgi:multidrug efflux pump subunit AcrA (membrane-fusion protein)
LFQQLAAAQATFDNAHEELERQKTLKAQNNSSERSLQSALATYRENMATTMGLRAKIQLAWGNKLADVSGPVVVPPGTERKPPPGPLPIEGGNVLVRLDLPAGESLGSTPDTARVVPLGTNLQSIIAQYYDEIPAVDPQTLMHSFLFYSTNSLKAGEPVTGYLRMPGEPLKGVIIPRDAVVRTEGKGWVYVMGSNGESFTRTAIPLDHSTEDGWFVAGGITSGDHIVVTGAQTLLSQELKASMSPD